MESNLNQNTVTMREPGTPLRWSPRKRPVTVERDSLKRMGVLGSPVPLRNITNNKIIARSPRDQAIVASATNDENHSSQRITSQRESRKSAWTLAPPPPLVPIMPKRKASGRPDMTTCKAHADRLRARLKIAYYKVQTHQETAKLSELDVSVPLNSVVPKAVTP